MNEKMKDVVLVDYIRTAQSRSRPREPERDWFYQLRGDTLCYLVVEELLKRTKINPADVGEFAVGAAFGVFENWTYGGRAISLPAMLPDTVPAMFIDRQCASGMTCIHSIFLKIATGYIDVGIAAGFEHMTRVPMGIENKCISPNQQGFMRRKDIDMATGMNMGLTAEKLAAEVGMSRERMDKWGTRSHNLAEKAMKEGYFDGEIMPLEVDLPDGTKKVVKEDQAVRKGATYESTATLKPAFKRKGIITAGNSSPLNAGAGALMLMTREKAKQYNLKPLAVIKSIGWAAVDPSVMGKGPVPASKMALKMAGLEAKDIDFWEINEAFAVVALYCIDQLGIDENKVNVKGGGCAIGHPLGMSGIRLVGTLARILKLKNAKLGLANMCVGGGQGAAVIIENEDAK
jgi:acetyl-CoA acyltransferase